MSPELQRRLLESLEMVTEHFGVEPVSAAQGDDVGAQALTVLSEAVAALLMELKPRTPRPAAMRR